MYILEECCLLLVFVKWSFCSKPNVCRTFQDYHSIDNNPKCYFNYAFNQLVPDIIKLGGMPFEEHKVTTSDGYILTMHRIPNTAHVNQQRSPVFLQHGLITTSGNFVALRNDSLAFSLANAGYDVWMGNYRGNQYSEGHVNLTARDLNYWNYCLDEISARDIPAFLNHIERTTQSKDKIVYIGHSLGTTVGLMFASDQPAEAKRLIKQFIMLAPAYTLSSMISPLRNAAYMADQLYGMITDFDMVRLVSHESATKPLIRMVCMESPRLMELCFTILRMIYGPNTGVLPDILPIFFDQHPSGSSIKIVRQVADFVTKSVFRKFNYGPQNGAVYRRSLPPDYDLQRIEVPVHLISSAGDWLTPLQDAYELYARLPARAKRQGMYVVPSDNFNHIDYVFGIEAKTLINDYVLKYLAKI